MKRIAKWMYATLMSGAMVANAQQPAKPVWSSAVYNVFADSVVQGSFKAVAVSDHEMVSGYQSNNSDYKRGSETAAQWKLSKDLSAYAQYRSAYPIADAIYNMSLEEMIRAVEPDSTFRTGKEWAGVWTRDISYSIILSMASLQPEVARYSLLRKVNKKKKIIQDTGTGGAWPVSSDRMIWAVAAWELYKVTGDKEWLRESFVIIKNSIEDDLHNIYDKETGLVKGESSFLDWREQTYPLWMQPADIFESENLGTNAVHYQANIVLAQMADLLHQPEVASRHRAIAESIKTGINKYLWQPDKKYYGQYLYGRDYRIVSPRSEALGEALCVLFGIAGPERCKEVIANTPVTSYGIPCIYPAIPGIPPYHNNAVWPFVQAYWLHASAMAGNERSVSESISAIYRPAAFFLTNKENFVSETGDYMGTQINSGNMLWSLAGNISIVHNVLFGIHPEPDRLTFHPFVPAEWKGKRTLSGFRYRGALLNIDMEGYGNEISSFLVDGVPADKPEISADIKGVHDIRIVLRDNKLSDQPVHKTTDYVSLHTPEADLKNGWLSWKKVDGALAYTILRNGKKIHSISGLKIKADTKGASTYQVIAIDKNGVTSFASEPLNVAAPGHIKIYESEAIVPSASYDYKGYSGKGFTELSTEVNTSVQIEINVTEPGLYYLDGRYANGNGPVNTENKCALRTVFIDDGQAGVWVFPQRGKGEWSNWGFSNGIKVRLSPGRHIITLRYLPANENMNEQINQAMLDYIRVTRLNP